MGYMKIENLYKNRNILMFKECYALEKIHGTSAHIKYKNGVVTLFSGGEKYDNFIKLFDIELLKGGFDFLGFDEVIIYGEAYGGKQQGMKATYGDYLKFIVFDVNINGKWLCVPSAEAFAKNFNLEYVPYNRVITDISVLNWWRDQPSEQALRNGIKKEMPREGVVLRPIEECTMNNGSRIICKHKADAFRETRKTRNLNTEQMVVLEEADEIANEWVTEMRLSHVLDKFHGQTGLSVIPKIIEAMINDIILEAGEEIEWSKEAKKAISRATANMYKKRLNDFKEGKI